MSITPEKLSEVNDFQSLAVLLHNQLDWPAAEWATFKFVKEAYGLPDDLPPVEAVTNLGEGSWGIFLVDFDAVPGGKFRRSHLRKMLNEFAERTRHRDDNPHWRHDNILFIVRHSGNAFSFSRYVGDKPSGAKLRSFGWTDPLEARTAIDNLRLLRWGADWDQAWNVEKLTRDFFTKLSELFFDTSDALAKTFPKEDHRRLFVQTLFNRLLFLRFVEKKGWLRFEDRPDYLRALWEAGQQSEFKFWPHRLNALFKAVNREKTDSSHEAYKNLIGTVEYLNGGLFDDVPAFVDPGLRLPDSLFEELLGPNGLFYRYNFTVEESSPENVEVAVDPEILGKIFEQLTISSKRHDTGSYYTPREIVQFMCREALIGYLGGKGLDEDKARNLVYKLDDTELSNPEGTLAFNALKEIKVVDPACGSGAYLLGMLQELYALFEKLRRDDRNKFSADPAKEAHERKLWIIENNLYGVDLQAFATNTAMLRLWLTLLVEDTGRTPQPLPNLEYKIEVGNSLLGPDPSKPIDWESSQRGFDFESKEETVEALRKLRETYQNAHANTKVKVKKLLEAKLAELREKVTGDAAKDPAKFDWRVEFFDVFLDANRTAGFDVATANPPYVNSGEMLRVMGKDGKQKLITEFPRTATGTADLLVYFMDRALELLRPGGQFAFITSNKWLKAAYGQKLRGQMAVRTQVHHLIDFGDLPVFQGTIAYPLITLATKRVEGDKTEGITRFTPVTSMNPPYPDLPKIINEWGGDLPVGSLGREGAWRLESGEAAQRLAKMRERGIPLGEYVKGRIYRGILTGLNEVKIGSDGKMYGKSVPPGVRVVRKEGVFVIDGQKRAELITEDPKSAEIIKPLAVGRDIRRWTVDDNDRWLIVTKIGTDMKRYPAIMRHLSRFEVLLKPRADQGEHWWELRACAYWNIFEQPRLVYQRFQVQPLFMRIPAQTYVTDAIYMLGSDEDYLLGVMNSQPFWQEVKRVCPAIQNGHQLLWDQFRHALVPKPDEHSKDVIVKLVQHILRVKAADPQADVSEVEAEIDRRVEFLYFGEGDSYEESLAKDVAEIRALLRRPAEDATLEFKETLWHDVKMGTVHGDRVLDVSKAICAMLNRDGGTILIGVTDDQPPKIVGIERDLDKLETPDKFQRKLQETFGVKLRPDPTDLVRVRFVPIDGSLIARVDVQGDPSTMFTLNDKVYIRRDGESREMGPVDTAHWWSRRRQSED